jgi:hypothetical protein
MRYIRKLTPFGVALAPTVISPDEMSGLKAFNKRGRIKNTEFVAGTR